MIIAYLHAYCWKQQVSYTCKILRNCKKSSTDRRTHLIILTRIGSISITVVTCSLPDFFLYLFIFVSYARANFVAQVKTIGRRLQQRLEIERPSNQNQPFATRFQPSSARAVKSQLGSGFRSLNVVEAFMDGSRSLGRLRHGCRVLLVVLIACSLYQDSCRCWAANDEEFVQVKVEEGVAFRDKDWFHRRLLQAADTSPSPPAPPSPPPPPFQPPPPPPSTGSNQPVPSPPPFQGNPVPATPPSSGLPPPTPPALPHIPPPESRTPTTTTASEKSSSKSTKQGLIIGLVVAGLVFLTVCGFCVFYWNSKGSHTVKPWMAGLSGQLQKAFVTGVPKLNRSELESACEDFSNVIGMSSIGKVFKGTLSSGVEIAVISLAMGSATDDWSKTVKAQFRKKIEALSKINHKNFINLIGYCEEDSPFTRMLVFEYAPNGTLFEHLHVQESEHLDWGMRLRISMGIAYCLEHMHQLKPPAIHKNLCSSAISLSEDYAAKVTDFTFWNEKGPTEIHAADVELMQPSVPSNIACFGTLLFETVTGKSPYMMSSDYIHRWASDYLRDSTKAPGDIVDPTLGSVPPAELLEIVKVIQSCVQPDSKSRPPMKEVTAMMREITGVGPNAATPKISPLWWAELEVISTE
uniref:Protein kinase domain-containing protein n=1 Tax=Kalanchoe fedtschenkoi TaxID=63787 RepID=A0A7N1A220_KALFE